MLSNDEVLEYQKLRDEYSLLANMIATTVTFSVAGSVGLIGLIANPAIQQRFFYFFLPLFIIFPACFIIISRLQSIIRLASYIYIFLESKSNLKYETRYLKFATKSKGKLTFSLTVLLIYAGLLIIDIALFLFKGFTEVRHCISYSLSVLFFGFIFYYIRLNWREKYIQHWKEVKSEES
jgi:hypothetical protein